MDYNHGDHRLFIERDGVVDWNWSGALLGLKLQHRLDDLTVWKTALQTRKGSKTPRDGLPDEGDKDAQCAHEGA